MSLFRFVSIALNFFCGSWSDGAAESDSASPRTYSNIVIYHIYYVQYTMQVNCEITSESENIFSWSLIMVCAENDLDLNPASEPPARGVIPISQQPTSTLYMVHQLKLQQWP
jgi:hypothetical protein